MDNPLEKRIADLEEQLASLRKTVAELTSQKSAPGKEPAAANTNKEREIPFTVAPQPGTGKKKQKLNKDPVKSGEVWIGRLGIGLLLFGAAFLFKYSIDQGWITPLVRVLFGFGLGIGLLAVGLRIYGRKSFLSRLLLGGGIASYYITIFSAFQLYHLFSHLTAFILMAAITGLAFLLALRQNEHTLSLLGALGGFLTPFLLYTGENNTIGLVTYTALLVAGSSLTYMARGWRLLLWFSSWASWIILVFAVDNTPNFGYLTDKSVIQGVIVLNWFALAVLPAIREYWHVNNPQKWSAPELQFAYKRVSKMAGDTFSQHIYPVIIATPIITLLTTRYTWNFTHETAGYINGAVALLYLTFFLTIRKKQEYQGLNFAHGLTGIVLFTWAVILIFDETAQFITIALESWALFMVAQKIKDQRLEKVAKLLLGLSSLILIFRVFVNNSELPFIFNPQAFADLLFLALLIHILIRMNQTDDRFLFFIAVHIGLMGWLLRELGDFNNGQGLVTITWGILAISVFVLGLRQNKIQVRYLGSVTIAVVVGKLFLVDLAELETIWRIILFSGFGGLLLFVSYFLEKMIKPSRHKEKEKAE